jgi:hypothetical protein
LYKVLLVIGFYQFCSGLGFPSPKRLAKLQIHAGEEWEASEKVSEKEALL